MSKVIGIILGLFILQLSCSDSKPQKNLNKGNPSVDHATLEESERNKHADKEPPLNTSFTINNGAEYTTSTVVSLELKADGASHMFITNNFDCISDGAWHPYEEKKEWTLGQSNSKAYVYVKFKDESDNESECLDNLIIHDGSTPTIESFKVNNGSLYTNNLQASLMIKANDGPVEMFISNSAGCTEGKWQEFSEILDWELTQTNSLSQIFIKLRDAANNESACISTSITHDIEKPLTPETLIADNHNSINYISLKWNPSSDTLSGIESYEVSIGSSPSASDIYSWQNVGNQTTTLIGDLSLNPKKNYFASIRAIDFLGNISEMKTSVAFTGKAPSLSLGILHSCSLNSDGQVKCWGNNANASLGTGSFDSENPYIGDDDFEEIEHLSYVDLGSELNVIQLSSGGQHNCVLFEGGSLKCWGSNSSGQLGLGETEARGSGISDMGNALPFVDLGNNIFASQISSGSWHSCAITTGGRVKCWGNNSFGQIGIPKTTELGHSPAHMGNNLPFVELGEIPVVSLASGAYFTCALLKDGHVKCWGENYYGQLGQGDSISRGVEQDSMQDLNAIELGERALQISASNGSHACALLVSGRVKCWGKNSSGQLGIGSEENIGDEKGELSPSENLVNLGIGLNGAPLLAKSVSTGHSHSCALLENSELKCWGSNQFGELGQGNKQNHGGSDLLGPMGDSLLPIYLGSGLLVKESSAGYNQTCAVFSDETFKCWGNNSFGQLGLGHKEDIGDESNGELGGASYPPIRLN